MGGAGGAIAADGANGDWLLIRFMALVELAPFEKGLGAGALG